ncbi:MAG: hypothetical protein E7047_06190 [Lentisphaerae bacterium]|nr:hypothetical protein [Lentisphaerota bacterium]
MNLQVRKVSAPRGGSRRRQQQKSGLFKFYVLFYCLVVAGVLFGALNYQIDLNRKISKLQQSSNQAKQEIKDLERDIQSLTVVKARLSSWENISRRIAELKLPLRPAEPGQVRYMTFKPGNRERQVTVYDTTQHNSNISLSHAAR